MAFANLCVGSSLAFNPQPDPPARFSQLLPNSQPFNAAGAVMLNPQPLPPGAKLMINPQPLPPKVGNGPALQ